MGGDGILNAPKIGQSGLFCFGMEVLLFLGWFGVASFMWQCNGRCRQVELVGKESEE